VSESESKPGVLKGCDGPSHATNRGVIDATTHVDGRLGDGREAVAVVTEFPVRRELGYGPKGLDTREVVTVR